MTLPERTTGLALSTSDPKVTVLTFFWGKAYAPEYVDRLCAAVRRHMTVPYRFVCVTDKPTKFEQPLVQVPLRDPHLTETKGCFCRLRTFDPSWQSWLGAKAGERILVLDLDLVITGSIGPLLTRREPFVILQGVNNHGMAFNGSVWMMTAGFRSDVWTDFSLESARKVRYASFPDDQSWMEAKLAPAAGAYLPSRDGVYAFSKPGWPKGEGLPTNARIVAFPGARDPNDFTHLLWVQEHWIDGA